MAEYTASNTDQQTLDTFALATVQSVDYRIHAANNTDSSFSIVTLTHDGISMSEVQESTSVGNNKPDEFVTAIANTNIGQLLITPSAAPVTYTFTKTETLANLYAQHTVSGKLIKHTEGIGIYFTGSANNMTVRSSNNFFGNSSQFVTADVLGPTMVGSELYASNNFLSYNGSELNSNATHTIVVSSGQDKSSHYIEIDTVPGEKYRVQANTFYSFEEKYGKTTTFNKGSRIAVGTAVGLSDITYVDLTTTETQYDVDFVATGNTAFVSFGYGSLGSSVAFRSLSIKELAPFPTYSQSNGTFYFKWNAVTADSNVVVMDSNRVFVDSSNNVFINTVNCGAQQATNKLAYTYDGNTVQHSFNGASVLSEAETYYANVTSCSLENIPEEMSYVPTIVSNTVLIGLTS